MTETKIYNINKMKQLIDLNKNIVNFDLTFKTECDNPNQEYYLIVVDQETLDNDSPLDYKIAKGSLSGTIISDKGIYQNYLLILKSDNDCKIKVDIDLKPIQIAEITPTENIVPLVYPPTLEHTNKIKLYSFLYNNYKFMIIGFIIIVLCVYVYRQYKYKVELNKVELNNFRPRSRRSSSASSSSASSNSDSSNSGKSNNSFENRINKRINY